MGGCFGEQDLVYNDEAVETQIFLEILEVLAEFSTLEIIFSCLQVVSLSSISLRQLRRLERFLTFMQEAAQLGNSSFGEAAWERAEHSGIASFAFSRFLSVLFGRPRALEHVPIFIPTEINRYIIIMNYNNKIINI